MIDYSRIVSGYDIEVLLGGGYFLTVLEGAYDAGEIPSSITTPSGTTIRIQRPTAARIITDGAEADLEVTIPVELVGVTDVTIGLGVSVTEQAISLEYRYLDDTTRGLIQFFGLITGQPSLLAEVETLLRSHLDRELELDLVGGDVAEVQVRKVPADGEAQAAFGLYLNLNLQVAPQSGRPEAAFVSRGNLDDARSFLPTDRAFAVGVGLQTFPRLANDMWHGLGVETEGRIDHPVMDGDERIGVYRSVQIVPREGALHVTVRSRIFVENWPDADVTAVLHFTPRVAAGALTFDIQLVEFDADTGLLGDLLGFLIGGILGALIGLLFGPVGVVIGAAIGGVGGIATVEVAEAVMEGKFSDRVEEEARQADVASAFSAFPVRKRLFSDERDPFFVRHFEVVSRFDEAGVTPSGMGFAGHAVMEAVNEPVPTTIVARTRGTGPESWHGLLSLTYHLASLGDVPMPIAEVRRRIPLKQLQRVALEPTHVRRKETVVTDVRSASGVDFHVPENVALQDEGALVLMGYQLIHPRNANPYYRAWADDRVDNNFESLPPF